MRKLLIAGVLLLLPSLVSAAPYVEFAPDYAEPLTVQPGTTVAQVFMPLNDRLSSVELWVSTGGVAAGLQASLLNASGTVVATRDVVLGSIPDSNGGTRTRISFPAQLSVNGGVLYRLNITPTGAAVKLYHSTSVAVAPGSGNTGATSFGYGYAVVGGQEQGYSFKFALTETAETTIPTLSGLQILQTAIGQALLTFTTQEPVDVRVVYGPNTTAWTGEYTPCLTGIMTCGVLLNTVPGTVYAYSATIRDVWGNQSVTNGSFTAVGEGPSASGPPQSPTPGSSATPSGSPTIPPVQTTPPPVNDKKAPVIINPRLLSLTSSSVTVAWTTDEAANSLAVILGEGLSTFDATFELEHYLSVGGLEPDRYYRLRVSSSDFWGNYGDILIIFTTPLAATTTPAASVSGTPSGSLTPPTPSPTPSYTVVMSPGLPPPTVSVSPSAGPTTSVSASPVPSTAGGTPTPSVVAYPSTSTQPGVISWPPSGGGGNGYRVDIFDENNNLITSITVDANTTSIPLPAGLPSGARIIVYVNHGGAFEKVGEPATITDRPFVPGTSPLLTPVIVIVGGSILLIALIVAFVWQRRRQRVAASGAISTGQGLSPKV